MESLLELILSDIAKYFVVLVAASFFWHRQEKHNKQAQVELR